MVLPFEPLAMAFEGIKYFVDMPAVCLLRSKTSPTIDSYDMY